MSRLFDTDDVTLPDADARPSAFTCGVKYRCDAPAAAHALFRGSLTPACADCALLVADDYFASLYDRHGQEVWVPDEGV